MTATIHALPTLVSDIPAMFRRLADDIEAGAYGDVSEAAAVVGGVELEVFGFGCADGTVAHYLFARAQRKLERIDLL